jgi:hypothetical protein
VAERPKEAPAGSLEKKISRRELATNSWKRHIKKLAVNSLQMTEFSLLIKLYKKTTKT